MLFIIRERKRKNIKTLKNSTCHNFVKVTVCTFVLRKVLKVEAVGMGPENK